MGPYSVIVTAVIKILIKLLLKGTSTFFIGEIANFVGCIAYALPASIIYNAIRVKKSAIYGLIIGILVSSCVITILNATFIFPLYINVFNMSEEMIVNICKAINPLIDNMLKVMLLSVLPFNLIKYTISSVITYIFYKHVSNMIKYFLKNE